MAVIFTALITLMAPPGVLLFGASTFDARGHFGTLASFGFLLIYLLVCLAAPLYLRRLKILRIRDVLYSVKLFLENIPRGKEVAALPAGYACPG